MFQFPASPARAVGTSSLPSLYASWHASGRWAVGPEVSFGRNSVEVDGSMGDSYDAALASLLLGGRAVFSPGGTSEPGIYLLGQGSLSWVHYWADGEFGGDELDVDGDSETDYSAGLGMGYQWRIGPRCPPADGSTVSTMVRCRTEQLLPRSRVRRPAWRLTTGSRLSIGGPRLRLEEIHPRHTGQRRHRGHLHGGAAVLRPVPAAGDRSAVHGPGDLQPRHGPAEHPLRAHRRDPRRPHRPAPGRGRGSPPLRRRLRPPRRGQRPLAHHPSGPWSVSLSAPVLRRPSRRRGPRRARGQEGLLLRPPPRPAPSAPSPSCRSSSG